jgi:Tol biopolymer transport system component
MRTITTGPGIHEVPSYSPDGQRIAFDYSPTSDSNAPGFETRLWTMRAEGRDAVALPMENPGFDVEPKYSPNGRWIAFDRLLIASDNFQQQAVFVVSSSGGMAQQLTPWSQQAEHPTWSPDSRWITYDRPEGTNRRNPSQRPRAPHDPGRHQAPGGSQAIVLSRRDADPRHVRIQRPRPRR